MEKFITGVVVGFFICKWLTDQQQQKNKDQGGYMLLKQDVTPMRVAPPNSASVLSGFISQNASR
jgi:hypothetical protein